MVGHCKAYRIIFAPIWQRRDDGELVYGQRQEHGVGRDNTFSIPDGARPGYHGLQVVCEQRPPSMSKQGVRIKSPKVLTAWFSSPLSDYSSIDMINRTQTTLFKKILVANRSEIAIRIFRAAHELQIPTVGIYSEEDRLTLHRFGTAEAYLVGRGKKPIDAYLDIDDIIRVALESGCDAIHPGYGFLAENPEFAERCASAGITFIGPEPEVMRRLGNKVEARTLAIAANVPVMPATKPLPDDAAAVIQSAAAVGYPLMLKASWGGGGRGMRVIEGESKLLEQVSMARREALSAFGNDEVYLEKLVRNARHVEVQIAGDTHGQVVHLFERDCSVQRRHQKIVERAPAPYLSETQRLSFYDAALRLARSVKYSNLGTVSSCRM